VVTADIEEAAELFVLAADDDDRFAAGKLAGDVVAGRAQLIETAGVLPASSKHCAELEFEHPRICVPRCGDREGALERRVRVVKVENLLEPLQIRSPPSDYAIRSGRYRLVIRGGARPSD
jgi:hypothetical protein